MVNATYPPAGTAFVGAFYYVDDFYNYLSYAQQAEDGAFLFTNKAILTDHAPALVNLEWWTVGALSRLMGGGHLPLAYRVFGIVAILTFLLVVDKWLRRLGLGESHRLPALLLVSTGGGLGGLLFTLFGREHPTACLDLFTGLFPFVGFLTNPHFTAGTTLLLLGLLAYDQAVGTHGTVLATVLATALALVRPYEFVLLVLIRGTAVLLLEPPRRWFACLLPLLALLPVAAYLYWLFYTNPPFAFYASTAILAPKATDYLLALGPAAILAVPGVVRPTSLEGPRRARLNLVLWSGMAGLVIAVRPVPFSLQFLVGIGVPLLVLGALGLARFRPAITLLVAAVFSATFATAGHFMLTPRSFWLTGRNTMAVVERLRTSCAGGDVLLAPADVGLFAYGLTACRPFLSYPASPNHQRKLHQAERLHTAAPAERRTFLDVYRVRHLVLSGDAGPSAEAWLGPDSDWARVASFGTPAQWSLYTRKAKPTLPPRVP
jgi:hypothetical protein